MQRPIIALDIDGVLVDWVGSALPRLNKILKTKITLYDGISFNLNRSFGVTDQEMQRAMDEMYKSFSLINFKPVENSKESVELLSNYYKLVAVTARPKEFWKITNSWITNNFDCEIEVMFGTAQGNPFGSASHKDPKIEICKKLNAKFIVEDNPAEIIEFKKTSTAPLCHAWPWNDEIKKHTEIIRGNWKELLEYLLSQV